MDLRQIKNDSIQIEDYDDQQQLSNDLDRGVNSEGRSESRLDRRRDNHHQADSSQVAIVAHNEIVDSYEYYGDNFDDADSDAHKRGSSSSGV